MNIGKKVFSSVFGIIGWGFLTLFVWVAFLYGGKEGYVLLAFNLLGELIFELFLITGIFILMLFSNFHILKEKEIKNTIENELL